jgi:hypothetical protein
MPFSRTGDPRAFRSLEAEGSLLLIALHESGTFSELFPMFVPSLSW